ncbi:MOSC domain-containing protein [Defluviimonas sp. WL0050]|uniref:MOSC domain-containing protein n=1 Tax=Albidovulum litorale TaxID=2984134 RepID=A0ABT2ZLI5_9RHOB|nr:MOSC N-terminal beta barrel domain-containing protein [Defluviimonas sp. WL0050]MCV2872001.1 MOSC domain-containing protein [Defluviimonas sp. WL0050]
MTPTVASLQRHPLKSHGREALSRVRLTEGQGLQWDRHWAVAHDAAKIAEGEWSPCQNFSRGSKAPKLMAINATLDEAAATLTLTHPERPDITFHPDDSSDAARFIDWVRPISPADRALPARIYSVEGRGMTDTDYPSVSLISLASNRALAEYMGIDLSPLRWRGNIWLEGLRPWEERDWIGRKLRVGGAVLEIVEPKERCLATTANPVTGERDADTLRALTALHGDKDFGLYAKVIESGEINVGDRAELLP